MDYKTELIKHYKKCWSNGFNLLKWPKEPKAHVFNELCILEFPPNGKRDMWTYSTCCMSKIEFKHPIEVHIFSKTQSDELIELLTVVADYQNTSESKLNLWHTVNFGKPWMMKSDSRYGLISLPYLDGPKVENFVFNKIIVKCYWLIPITEKELEYKKKMGVESLESLFENSGFDYSNPLRKSIV